MNMRLRPYRPFSQGTNHLTALVMGGLSGIGELQLFASSNKTNYGFHDTSVARLCRVMKVSRSGFYARLDHESSPREVEDERVFAFPPESSSTHPRSSAEQRDDILIEAYTLVL